MHPSSANAWKHADILVYNALLHAHYHMPVHSIVLLLRPRAAHSNRDGSVNDEVRPGRPVFWAQGADTAS